MVLRNKYIYIYIYLYHIKIHFTFMTLNSEIHTILNITVKFIDDCFEHSCQLVKGNVKLIYVDQ